MKSKSLFFLGMTLCLVFVAFPAVSQDVVPDHKLSEFKLGEHVSGEETDLSKLKGQVVAIEYWGTR